MRSAFTVSLGQVELDTRLAPNKLPDEGRKVKISRDVCKDASAFSLGQHIATIRRLHHPQFRQAGIALRILHARDFVALAKGYGGIAESAVYAEHRMHFLV